MKSPFLGFGSEHALRKAVADLTVPAFTTDAAGRVASWNHAAQRLAGVSLEGAPALLAAMASAGAPAIDAVRRRDGRVLRVVRSAAPFRDAAGAVAGAVEAWALVPASSPSALPCDAAPRCTDQDAVRDALAGADVTVLVRGEPGPERDGIVRALHHTVRGSRPIATVACRAVGAAWPIPPAWSRGGTVLLEEVGELSADGQRALLGFLDRRAPRPSDGPDGVRVLCTTGIDLGPLVDACSFRADLHLRLGLFTVRARAEQLAAARPPRPVDEREALAEALLKCGGSRTLAARELGISRVTLWKRMKRYGVYDLEVG